MLGSHDVTFARSEFTRNRKEETGGTGRHPPVREGFYLR